jgi:hypothetical protein
MPRPRRGRQRRHHRRHRRRIIARAQREIRGYGANLISLPARRSALGARQPGHGVTPPPARRLPAESAARRDANGEGSGWCAQRVTTGQAVVGQLRAAAAGSWPGSLAAVDRVDAQLVVTVVQAGRGEHGAGVVEPGQPGPLGPFLGPAAARAGQPEVDDVGGGAEPPARGVNDFQGAQGPGAERGACLLVGGGLGGVLDVGGVA